MRPSRAGGDAAAPDAKPAGTAREPALAAFRKLPVQGGLARRLPPATGLRVLESGRRLAGICSVVVDRRMPDGPAFGPLHLSDGGAVTDDDSARHYLVRTTAASATAPVAGLVYPEARLLGPADRVIRLAEAHVGCTPTGRRQLNPLSMQGRLTLAHCEKIAEPHGTTCAIFLPAVLVSTGDGRFLRHTDRLGVDKPGRGHTAHGMGAGYPAVAGEGWQESGHVGVIVEAEPAGDRIEVTTVDGGQRQGDEVRSPGKGWYTKRRRGLIRRQREGGVETGAREKLPRDRHGVLIPPRIKVSPMVRPVEPGGKPVRKTKTASRKLPHWVSLGEVAGGFVEPPLRTGGRTIHTTL